VSGPPTIVPPTYDLRQLGEGLGIYRRLDALADGFLAVAEEQVGAAFRRVTEFSTAAAQEQGREAEPYRRTTWERYLLELLACVVMGRQSWPEFAARRDTVLILPDCLRARLDTCKRARTRYGHRCTRCRRDCTVRRMSEVGERFGVDAYFAEMGVGRQLRAMQRGRYKNLAVIGVACIWMLAQGMRAAEAEAVPSQGVLLSYCGCEHWVERPFPTDAAVERVEEILAAKCARR
jgi:hypothetical protein